MSDHEPSKEKLQNSRPTSTRATLLNLQAAVEMGEYEPEYLARFPEWLELTPSMQFEFVRKGIEQKRHQLRLQYATTFNAPNFSQKPHLEEAITNIFARLRVLQEDEERLSIFYSRLI